MIHTFGVKNDSPVFLDHQEKFFSEVFFPRLDEENIKLVFDLGDTFDRRKYINFVTLERVRKFFFNELKKRDITYHALVGNHSVFYTNTNEINSMDLLLNEYPKFHIYVDKPELLKVDSVSFLMVPWMSKNIYSECLDEIKTTSAEYVLGHFSITGFEMLKGTLCEHGLDAAIFSRFEGVYSGHFHHPSAYGNIRYLGAQYEMTWADYGESRGFHIFNTKDRSLEFVENTNRIFHKLDYDDTDLTIADLDELDFGVLKNAYVKVLIKNRTNTYLFDLFLTKLNECGAADVKTIEDTLNLDSIGLSDVSTVKDTKDILHEYIDNIKTDLSKNKIKELIDKLYVEASLL